MKDKLGDLSREHYRLYENGVLSKQQYSDLSDMLDKAINYTQCCEDYCNCEKPTLGKNTWTCGCGKWFKKLKK